MTAQEEQQKQIIEMEQLKLSAQLRMESANLTAKVINNVANIDDFIASAEKMYAFITKDRPSKSGIHLFGK